MGYWKHMIDFMSQPFTNVDIENIINFQESIKRMKNDKRLIEYNEQKSLKPKFRKEEYRNKKFPKIPMGNKFWESKLINGEWINIPIEPDEDIEEIFVDGIGYIPTTRMGDLKL